MKGARGWAVWKWKGCGKDAWRAWRCVLRGRLVEMRSGLRVDEQGGVEKPDCKLVGNGGVEKPVWKY